MLKLSVTRNHFMCSLTAERLFLVLLMHLSFEEIIADLNSVNPTSAISCFASFTGFFIVANQSIILCNLLSGLIITDGVIISGK